MKDISRDLLEYSFRFSQIKQFSVHIHDTLAKIDEKNINFHYP